MMKRTMQRLTIAMLGLSVAACGGASTPIPVPSPSNTGGGGGGGTTPGSRTGSLTLSITVPPRVASTVRRRPHYVSPSTQSLTISITGPTNVAPQTINLTPSSPGCASGSQGLQCQTSISGLLPGSYVGNVSTYDGTNGTGNVLSIAQAVAFSISAGYANPIALSLAGVPQRITIAPVSAIDTVPTGPNTYAIIGTQPQSFVIEALDADGNIITGAGAPTFTVAQTGGSFTPLLVQPTHAVPNEFSAQTPASWPSGSNATLTVTASFSAPLTNACTGGVCTGTITVSPRELMAVSNSPSTTSSVSVYDIASGTPVLLTTITLPNGTANAKFDPFGNLFVASNPLYPSNPTPLTEFLAPTYSASSAVGITSIAQAHDMAFTPAGTKMFVSDPQLSGVYAYTLPSGPISPTAAYSTLANPGALAISPDGTVLLDGNATVVPNEMEIALLVPSPPNPTVVELPGCVPESVAVSADSARAFVACRGTNSVDIVQIATGLVDSVVSTANTLQPYGVAYEPLQNGQTLSSLCVANAGNATAAIVQDNGDGTGSVTATVNVNGVPRSVAVDAQGECYVATFTGGSVYQVNMQTYAVTAPLSGIGYPTFVNILP